MVPEERVKVVIEEKFKEIEKVVPYIQSEIREVELIKEKAVLNNVEV